MARYPQVRSASLPVAVRDPAPLRLVHSGGDPPGRRGDGRDRRLPGVRRLLLRPLPPRAGRQAPGARLHQHLLLDARRRRAARLVLRGRRAPTATRPATAAPSAPTARSYVSGFECLGACDLAPMASIDERYYGPLDDADALAAIAALRDGAEVLPERQHGTRPAAGDATQVTPHKRPTPRRATRAPGARARSAEWPAWSGIVG